jgi:hypothetical protein
LPRGATLETLASCYISRLDRTVRLVESLHKKNARLRVFLMQATAERDHKERDAWLSQEPADRIANLETTIDVHEHELSDQFKGDSFGVASRDQQRG